MITAKFGSKSFEVSSKKIYTPNGVSISEEINLEEVEMIGKKPHLSFQGIKLRNLSFELKLDSRFVDVYTEMHFWEKTLKGHTPQYFQLGSYKLGKYYLSKTDLKDIILDKNGDYAGASLTLTFIEDGRNENQGVSTTSNPTKKATEVKASTKSSTSSTTAKVRKGSTIKPKSGVRWYYTAEGAIKKSGKSGKAYQKNMTVTYTYSKSGKIVCVNPQGLGWLKVEDVTVVKY